jgi:hypothetical protein
MQAKNKPRRLVISLRDCDGDWWPALARLADEKDRTPAHMARQLVVAGLLIMGAVHQPRTAR